MVIHTLSLCSGIGGLDLGLREGFRRLGIEDPRTVCYVEREAYPVSLMVQKMQTGAMDLAPIWSDLTTFNGKDWRGRLDCILGGYPCQPFSLAGKQKGKADDRHLWPHIARIIEEIRPSFCFFENVSGHLHNGLRQVVSDLQGMGYEVAATLWSAEEVGAVHKRERLWILATANGCGVHVQPRGSARDPHTDIDGMRKWEPQGIKSEKWRRFDNLGGWSAEPRLARLAHGVPDRLDRERALGNAVVPACAASAFVELARATGLDQWILGLT